MSTIVSPQVKTADDPQLAHVPSSLFATLIVYYWAIQFIRGDSIYTIDPSVSYYLFVVPAICFGVFGLFFALMTQSSLNRTSILIASFCAVVIIVAAGRADIRTILTIGLLSINLIVFFQLRPKVSLDLINLLFLLAGPITTILFFNDLSIYTIFPGLNDHPFQWWRISPFPSAAEGGLFAMVVLLANVTTKGQRFRIFFIVFAAYLLILTGNRTALFGTLLGLAFVALTANRIIVTDRGRLWFLAGAVGVFLTSVFASQLLLMLPFADNAFVREVILRDEVVSTQFDMRDQVGTAAIRVWIIEQHLSIFTQNPLFGVGTFDFLQFNTGYGAIDDLTTGSEAFASALFARVGLPAVLLFAALLLTRQPGNQVLGTCSRIGLTAGMITYGSFVNAYDFVFVLLVLGVAGCIVPSAALPDRRSPDPNLPATGRSA